MIPRPTLGSLPNSRSFRGQPLAIMLAVLAIWFGLRASLWTPLLQSERSALVDRPAEWAEAIPKVRTVAQDGRPTPWRKVASRFVASAQFSGLGAAVTVVPRGTWFATPPSTLTNLADRGFLAPPGPDASGPAMARQGHGSALGLAPLQQVGFSLASPISKPIRRKHLSIDGWLFLREGSAGAVGAAPLGSTYGGSQFGAVLRYDLGPRTAYPPQAYLRATGAVDSQEADLAAGISIRPVPALPLRAHGEVRLSRLGVRTEVRPAAFVTADIEEALPLGARVRGYAQAGYVGGEFATAFADGSVVLERDAKRFEHGAFALGVGAWGGAQEGTERLDAGPSASLDLRLGEGRVRLAADYRFRVAGDAEPSSGAALTLSTSF